MRLGLDEIKGRAKAFSEEWQDTRYEKGEARPFYNAFFQIFGIDPRQVASFEKRVESLDVNHRGFVDLYWPGTLIVEQRHAGRYLLATQPQAPDYFDWLPERDRPRFVLICDFQNWRLLDLEERKELKFLLKDLHRHITAFDFMLGRKVGFETQASVTVKAAELMCRLHNALEKSGYTGHDLEQLLVRLLFCLFADDIGIFQPKDIFLTLLESDTRPDGSDVGRVLNELFDILDTPEGQRRAGTSVQLDAFPYVNGALFRGRMCIPGFDAKSRDLLLDAARHDWSGVSPATFGSRFQSVMDAKKHRAKGAHYATEANILKVIVPLFLADLKAELTDIIEQRTGRDEELAKFRDKLTRLTFFDPACGCGKFLVIAYCEVRRLELEALKVQYGDRQIDAAALARVRVDQFYGIENDAFQARIAEVAMWVMDHIANNEINEAFGLNYARIPLKDSAHILHSDALEADWSALLPSQRCSYILSSPPFLGAKLQTKFQREQVRRIAGRGGNGGTLDYAAAWFIKAGQYMNGIASPPQSNNRHPELVSGSISPSAPSVPVEEWMLKQVQHDETSKAGGNFPRQPNHRIRIGFVATNSICQSEQAAQLWPILFNRFGLEIAFAHHTFSWSSEAHGKAHVHAVIVGLAHRDHGPEEKRLFSYPDIKSNPVESRHEALTAYLFDAREVANRHLVVNRSRQSLSNAPRISAGTKPVDGGHYIFDAAERASFLAVEPEAAKALRPFLGDNEFINGGRRWILHVVDLSPSEQQQMPKVIERISAVSQFRSTRAGKLARQLADTPTAYHVSNVPSKPYLVLPEVSSDRHEYVPIGWIEPPTIPGNKLLVILDAELWHFAILTSRQHMAWLEYVGGRMESRFQYSPGMVYNTFPLPDATPEQREKIEVLAQAVLDARAEHPASSLAELYDPDAMPANLRRAHAALDAAVDKLYRSAPFANDRDRVEHLFGRYEALVNPLERLGAAKNKRVARKAAKHSNA